MRRRTIPERVARVEQRLLLVVAAAAFLAGLWLAGGLSLALLVPAAAVVGFGVRPAAEAVVRRRVSVWAVLGDDEDPAVEALPPPDDD